MGPHCHIYRYVEPVLLYRLLVRGCSYGYQLLGDLEEHALVGGAFDSAALYRTLRHLEAAGMVTSEWEISEAGPARRRYQLTEAGLERLAAWEGSLQSLGSAIARFLAGVDSAREPSRT